MQHSTLVSSWGNVLCATHAVFDLHGREQGFPALPSNTNVLPFGNGRSYGDSCLNTGGALLRARGLDRFIAFDRQAGVLACEAGVLLADILRLTVPAGWFLPVVPGTQYVTVGGAIANDVHGKNHHCAGTFGAHVHWLELLRSDGTRRTCSLRENADLFRATIGGLGLTGLIVAAQLQLKRIPGPWMAVETIRYRDCDEFFRLSEESDRTHEYTVAWIDCLARGKHLGRGLLQRANHSAPDRPRTPPRTGTKLSIPFTPPTSLVNPFSLRLFNSLHYHRQRRRCVPATRHSQSFFFPLDTIRNWNRLYGPRGFYQYQCVIPTREAPQATARLLEKITTSGLGSFLAVLKSCGPAISPGMLSFPLPGVTLALDFPNQPGRLPRLFTQLDEIVARAGGRLYPAKDGRMPPELFRSGYPRWQAFRELIDPRCSSDFWRRVTSETGG
jgi:FAD/FMN-containing dehydrogenase